MTFLSSHHENDIGPLFEYLFLNEDEVRHGFKENYPLLMELRTTRDHPLPFNFEHTARIYEFTRCPRTARETEDPWWQMFCRRFRNAGLSAGFRKEFVTALTGTLYELAGNTIEHSRNPQSAIAGYRWSPGEFEFCIGDSGIGSLQSLKAHPYYSWLLDSGQALDTMIVDGESSKGPNLGCGTGFHALVHNIASENSIVRFRSGDHCLVIDGTRPNPLKVIAQRPELTGLVISSRSSLKKELAQP